MFKRTVAVNKLLSLTKRIRVVPGGTWAGKTYDIIAIEIDHLVKHPKTKTTVVCETIPAIKDGALKDFKEIMQDTGRWFHDRYNSTERTYTFGNKSTIQFTAFENEGKAKQAGKRDRLFINEANTTPKSVIDALMIRTSGVIWLDYNPSARFWVNEELEGRDHVDWLTLTYRDNEALPETILAELLRRRERAKTSSYWQNWCDVYLDGKIGSLEGVCIKDWVEIERLPVDEDDELECRVLCYGMDFGYTNDPTTLVAMYKWNDAYIFDEIFYRKGMLNSDIANLIKSEGITDLIYADSAEPKSIAELHSYGITIKGAPKGRDSIMYGVNLLNQNKIYITSRSHNIKKELQGYTFATDKAGDTLNKPVDAFNHTIDSMRYAIMGQLDNPTQGKYAIW